MAFRKKKKGSEETVSTKPVEKVLDVDAAMQGSLTFRDPVNLRINGKFEGNLDTKGNLVIGEHAQVKANVIGEDIVISGKVTGNVVATNSLGLSATAYLIGDIRTPRLNVTDGAVLQGKCDMSVRESKISRSTMQQTLMTVDELAKYLEVDTGSVLDWAKSGRIPAQKEGNSWKFDRSKIDTWIASEKIK
ncbi:polymer-forming cytoskeletal protein [Candidatus Omnitrophota bacterium]